MKKKTDYIGTDWAMRHKGVYDPPWKPGEPRSTLVRYAYGYSDRKPGASFWIILAIMVAIILYHAVEIHW